jgi:uncharacterized membrane protein
MDPSQPLPTTPAPPRAGHATPSDTTAKIVYILYLGSLLVGVTSLIGVVMAYLNVGEAPEPLRSHYRFQIRTFWIGLLYSIAGFLLLAVAIGAAVFVLVAIWLIVRCAKGLKYLGRGEPYPNATTWLW